MSTPTERRPASEAALGDIGKGCNPGQREGGAWTLWWAGPEPGWAGPELFWKNFRGNVCLSVKV